MQKYIFIIVLMAFLNGFAQGSDTLGFNLTIALDCTATDFNEHYDLSFIGDNNSFYHCQYELTPIESGVSIRIYGSYEYVINNNTSLPILVISKRSRLDANVETHEQYFVAFNGFWPNRAYSDINTLTATIGQLKLRPPYYYIRAYKGKPMVNGNIYVAYDFWVEENEWQTWQQKMPHVTKIKSID